jgi:hypothetical protein
VESSNISIDPIYRSVPTYRHTPTNMTYKKSVIGLGCVRDRIHITRTYLWYTHTENRNESKNTLKRTRSKAKDAQNERDHQASSEIIEGKHRHNTMADKVNDGSTSSSPEPNLPPPGEFCWACKTEASTYHPISCECVIYCKKCAMKCATGGICKRCHNMYGTMRRAPEGQP